MNFFPVNGVLYYIMDVYVVRGFNIVHDPVGSHYENDGGEDY